MRGIRLLLSGAIVGLSVASAWRLNVLLAPIPAAVAPRLPEPIAAEARRSSASQSEASPWARPLFRQPDSQSGAQADVTGTAGSSTKLPRLVGIVADGNRRLAVILYEGALLRIAEKQKIGSWTVARIDLHSALLQDAQTLLRVRLDSAAHDN